MTIKLNPLFLEQKEYLDIFSPDKDGNVSMETLKSVYKDSTEQEIIQSVKENITVFTVEQETPKKSK